MSERDPTSAVNVTETWDDNVLTKGDPAYVIAWEEVRDRIAGASDYWVSTVRASGAPHVRPVFAVWVDGLLVSTTNGTRAKARNLEANPRVSFATRADGIDLIIEGRAAFVTDTALLERIAQAYLVKYGWPLEIREGEGFHAPFAAPAAGPPPFRPYAVTPLVVYAMGVTDELGPRTTRFTFQATAEVAS
ncbi:pyridoxamine 5'-phosphate oxidase family protein [Nocardioides sp.]|uniref:pyridoxamine 5'-phosphate oxidase family protein n=1 Tax=Nocardioides sp. TaxID=35761 RepID=UPI0027376E61|nr:pyridoxamine 5'-phosphate oxidase family protein [Nocardioides sp.]MDP3891325.1 pyridoxamine 5'-phosphate oxidase family protein [Nocardioides sp.]